MSGQLIGPGTIAGTALSYDRARTRMGALTATADTLQGQIATGKKLTVASQDPSGWQRLQGLARSKADADAFDDNIVLAQAVLAQTDGALSDLQNRLAEATRLATQANAGMLSASDRKLVADQLDAIVADIATIGRAEDLRGQPLFDADAPAIPVATGLSVQANESPARVFGDIADTLATFVTALRSGDNAAVAPAAKTALAAIAGSVKDVAAVQGSVGARAARVDLAASAALDAAVVTETQRIALEDTDLTAAITELQKTMTILQATQASFAKLNELSLFNLIR